MKEGTHVQKKKKKKGKEILLYNIITYIHIYFSLNKILTFTHQVRSGLEGLNVEARFLPHQPKPKASNFVLRVRANEAQ
jgi:hypothetical protein